MRCSGAKIASISSNDGCSDRRNRNYRQNTDLFPRVSIPFGRPRSSTDGWLLASLCQSGIKTVLQFVTKHLSGCRQHETMSRMAASVTTILRGKALLASTDTSTGAPDTVLPYPLPH